MSNKQQLNVSPFFPPGIPSEDPHAWANDTCFLTRLADEASTRYNNSSASDRAQLQLGASAAPLACVARVVSDEDEHIDEMLPQLSIFHSISKSAKKIAGRLWHRWWNPNLYDTSLVANVDGEIVDLTQIPTEQLKLAFHQAIQTGDEAGASNAAAELARRRENPAGFSPSDNDTTAGSSSFSMRKNGGNNNIRNNMMKNSNQSSATQQSQASFGIRQRSNRGGGNAVSSNSPSIHRYGDDDDVDNNSNDDYGGGLTVGSLWQNDDNNSHSYNQSRNVFGQGSGKIVPNNNARPMWGN